MDAKYPQLSGIRSGSSLRFVEFCINVDLYAAYFFINPHCKFRPGKNKLEYECLEFAIKNVTSMQEATNTFEDINLRDYKLENGKLIPPSSSGFRMQLLVKNR